MTDEEPKVERVEDVPAMELPPVEIDLQLKIYSDPRITPEIHRVKLGHNWQKVRNGVHVRLADYDEVSWVPTLNEAQREQAQDVPSWREAPITISGVELNFAQSMTLRVAVQRFAMSLSEEGLGNDATAKAMCEGYLRCLREINELIMKTAR